MLCNETQFTANGCGTVLYKLHMASKGLSFCILSVITSIFSNEMWG